MLVALGGGPCLDAEDVSQILTPIRGNMEILRGDGLMSKLLVQLLDEASLTKRSWQTPCVRSPRPLACGEWALMT